MESSNKVLKQKIRDIEKESQVKSLLFYDIEHKKQKQLYMRVNLIIDLYRQHTDSHSVRTINRLLSAIITSYPDKSVLILRDLGIWALPPPENLLTRISTLVGENKIKKIIDYGAGSGL